jgi:hypothetical protein
MIRLGVSLPAVMKLLGHKTIRMTLRYVQITQRDLQREFHLAHQLLVHRVPELSISTALPAASDQPAIVRMLIATRHLLEMYRRQFKNHRASRTIRLLDGRLHSIAVELDRFSKPKNDERLAGASGYFRRGSLPEVANGELTLAPDF